MKNGSGMAFSEPFCLQSENVCPPGTHFEIIFAKGCAGKMTEGELKNDEITKKREK